MSDCTTTEPTSEGCPNAVCDDRLADLPKRTRIRVLGVEPCGNCMVEFKPGKMGFLVADGDGTIITERPCVAIPILKAYAVDPTTGAIITDAEGDPVETAISGWDHMVISSGDEGCQNRVAGLPGIPADLHWNGSQFVLEPDEASGVTLFSDYPAYSSLCDTYNMVLHVEQVCDPVLGNIQQATVGYQPVWPIPCGMIVPFGGADEKIPAGWLKCDGGSVSITEYACLYSTIGINYGGAGANFTLPDLRGRTPIGIRDAAPAIDAIGLGDIVGITSGASAIGKTYENDYASLAVDPVFGMSTPPINGSIAATMSNLASGTTSYDFNFNVTVPAGATHVVLAAWVRTACLTLGHSCRNLVQIGLTPGALASAGRYIVESVSGVVEDEVGANGPIADNLGSRYDFQVKSDGTAFDVATVVNFNARVHSNGTIAMTKYYAYEVFQHGFRFGEQSTDTELLGTNFIIFAGCPAPGGSIEE